MSDYLSVPGEILQSNEHERDLVLSEFDKEVQQYAQSPGRMSKFSSSAETGMQSR